MEQLLLKGREREYHVDRIVEINQYGTVLSAFSTETSRKGEVRKNYAVVCGDGSELFLSRLNSSIENASHPVSLVETIPYEGEEYYIIGAKESGKPVSTQPRGVGLRNKGYLMIVLALLILGLLYIWLNKSQEQPVEEIEEQTVESVEL
jgi:hypothetical protein